MAIAEVALSANLEVCNKTSESGVNRNSKSGADSSKVEGSSS